MQVLSLFRNKFDKFNNTATRMLDSILISYDIKITLKWHFCCENVKTLSSCKQRCYGCHYITLATDGFSILMHRGSYMSTHPFIEYIKQVLGKSDKMGGLLTCDLYLYKGPS